MADVSEAAFSALMFVTGLANGVSIGLLIATTIFDRDRKRREKLLANPAPSDNLMRRQ